MKNVVDGGFNVNVKRIEKDFQTTAVVGYVEIAECSGTTSNHWSILSWVIRHQHGQCSVVDMLSIAAVIYS